MSRSRQQADEPQSILEFEWCVCVKIDVLGAIKKYRVCAFNKTCFGQNCACNIVTQQLRGTNQVSELILLDNTGTMMLDLWNEQISQVQLACVYPFTSLSTSYWNNSKKLTSTMNTAIKQSFQSDLSSLQFNEGNSTKLENEHTIYVPMISTVEQVQRYKTCCNYNKRLIQLKNPL